MLRTDGNQADLVRAIRCVPGWQWVSLETRQTHAQRYLGDGLLRAGWWPPGLCLNVEIKTEKGKLRPHQELNEKAGGIVVVRTFEDIQAVMDLVARKFQKPDRFIPRDS